MSFNAFFDNNAENCKISIWESSLLSFRAKTNVRRDQGQLKGR